MGGLLGCVDSWLAALRGRSRDALRQLLLFALADAGYEAVRGLATGRASNALSNAQAIIRFERATGTFFEPRAQALVVHHRWLVVAANWGYMNVQFTLNAAFLVWLFVCRMEVFHFVRNVFLTAMGLALIVHWLLPVAPPRMFAADGFVDTIRQVAHVDQDTGAIGFVVNPYAAVPSMHVAFALIVGVSGGLVVRSRALRAGFAAYPLLVFALVLVTANHFWVDAAAGAATAGVAAWFAARVLAPLRPASWAWPAAAPALGADQLT